LSLMLLQFTLCVSPDAMSAAGLHTVLFPSIEMFVSSVVKHPAKHRLVSAVRLPSKQSRVNVLEYAELTVLQSTVSERPEMISDVGVTPVEIPPTDTDIGSLQPAAVHSEETVTAPK